MVLRMKLLNDNACRVTKCCRAFIELAYEWQNYRHGNTEYREDRREAHAGNAKHRNWCNKDASDNARQNMTTIQVATIAHFLSAE